jgi:hypothetical protein
MSNLKPSVKGTGLYIVIILVAFLVGDFLLTAAFLGTLMLLGMIVMIENIPPLKWFMAKTSKVVDLLIFGFTVMATASYGLNITAALTIAGIGYTIAYAPRLREEQEAIKKKQEKKISNGRRHYKCD